MPTPSHGYVVNGQKVPGTTTVIGRYKNPKALEGWIWKCGRDGVDYRKAGRDAANIGTAVHDAIERHIKGEPQVSNPTEHYELPFGGLQKAKRCFEAFKDWQSKYNPEFVAIEPQLVHLDHLYGGTIDAVAKIGGELCLVDWKTSNGIYDETAMQCAAYIELWHHTEGQRISTAHVLRMDKKSPKWEMFTHTDLAGYFEHFLRLLDCWNADKKLFPVKWSIEKHELLQTP